MTQTPENERQSDELSPEQQRALEELLVECANAITRKIETYRALCPELTVEWDLRVRGNEGERSWLGRIASSEEIVEHPL